MLTLKTTIGIAVEGENLQIVCLKRTLGGLRESGRMTLSGFRALRPADVGAAYREFLRGAGLSNANAVVALPRRDVLLRVVTLPAEAAKTLDKAIEYQVDTLHPFEEGAVDYAYSVLHTESSPGQSVSVRVAVVMVEKGIAASYYDWFAQAGIPVAGFTTSAAVLYAEHIAAAPIFIVARRGDIAEIVGISSEALVSREVPVGTLERELDLCRAEMRLPAEAEVKMIEQPDLAYAAAKSGLSAGAFAINLLPAARRVYQSPWSNAPTYVLAGVVTLLLIAMGLRTGVQDRLYLQQVNREIRALDAKVKYAQKLETKEGHELTRIAELRSLKARTPMRMQVLAELTRVLPATVFLQDTDIGDDTVNISGLADSTAGLLALLGTSPYFRNPEFTTAIVKNNDGKEQFRIRMQVTGGGR